MKRMLLGPHAVLEALNNNAGQLAVVYFAGEHAARADRKQLIELCKKKGIACESRERTALDNLSQGIRHQGVVAVASHYPYIDLESLLQGSSHSPLFIALDQITDPHNFGAIIRSAVALGSDGIISLKRNSAPVTAAVIRTSSGATERARIARVTNLARTLSLLQKRGMQVIGLDASAPKELHELDFPEKGRVLVVGSEQKGLRRLVRQQCDELARIALPGPITSLNASVAAGIALYQSANQRKQ